MKKLFKYILIIFLALGLFLFLHSRRQPEVITIVKPSPSPELMTGAENRMILLIDEYRQSKNLSPLKYNEALYQSASISAHMILTGEREWSHKGYIEIIKKSYGSDYLMIGENLARDFTDDQGVFKAWVASKAHNDNLLDPRACEYGYANYTNVSTSIYVLHIGCKIKLPKPAIKGASTPRIGLASYYSVNGCIGCSKSRRMANGEVLDDSKLTVAHNQAKLNSFVKITNLKNGKTVTVKVTDRGNFDHYGKIADLSLATKEALGCGDVCRVKVEL